MKELKYGKMTLIRWPELSLIKSSILILAPTGIAAFNNHPFWLLFQNISKAIVCISSYIVYYN